MTIYHWSWNRTPRIEMDLDNILEQIGEFGKFQIQNYLLICLPVIFSAANSLTYVFTAAIPKYRCFVPSCDDPMNATYDSDWVPYAVPPNKISRSSKVFEPDQCFYYKQKEFNGSEFCEPDDFTNETLKCNEWVFDPHERSIVNDWLITCPENEPKLALVGTMHFAGIAFGTVVSGFLADRFGRKNIFILSILLMAITGVLQVISGGLFWFYIFMFLNAVGTAGVYPLAFILGVEMVGKSKREIASMALNYFYAVGEAMVGILAWLSRDWIILQIAASAPPVLFILIIPDSTRWLIAKGRLFEAKAIIDKAAHVNGKEFTSIVPVQLTSNQKDKLTAANKREIWTTFKAIIRSGGCGALSTSARFAALLAPFVPLLEHIDRSFPLTLFGIIAFIGGFLTLILPETLNTKLPETVQDAENLGRKILETDQNNSKEIEITRL
uniref:CSON004419 protein n=1 Tax=Culicoides sonorensis TaxID=179676 RepID=A0A336L4Z8_CULSO